MTLAIPIPDLLAALLAGGGVVLGLAIGVALLWRRGAGRTGNPWLGLFLIAASLTVLNEILLTLELYRLSPHFWVTPLLYTFSLGPLLYLFVRQRLEPARPLARRDAWHFVVPVYQIVHEAVTGLGSLELKEAYWQSAYGFVYSRLDTWIFIASFGLYLTAAFRLLARSPEAPERGWLGRLLVGSALVLGVALAMDVADALSLVPGGTGWMDWLELAEVLAYSALLYWTAVTGFVHAQPLAPVPEAAEPRQRRETYGMSGADLTRHAERLRAHVEQERPHLAPDLTLGTLADRLALTDKELSYVLNAGLETSYADFVNGLRVAEAQRLLSDPASGERTVLEIAMAAGFASKPTFNRVFKAATGQTPSAFRAERQRLMAS